MFMLFLKAEVRSWTQATLSRIWTLVYSSISYDDNRYIYRISTKIVSGTEPAYREYPYMYKPAMKKNSNIETIVTLFRLFPLVQRWGAAHSL